MPGVPGLTGEAAADSARELAPDDAERLVADLSARPWGQASPSIYETARLVSLAPWLTGDAQRVRFLLDAQSAEGDWGPAQGYQLVPTLSATEALLARVNAGGPSAEPPGELASAAGRGLAALAGWLRSGRADELPDMPAIDLIVPALTEQINRKLDRVAETTGLAGWPVGARLVLPAGMDGERLVRIRRALSAGSVVPEKLLHSLEVLGTAAHRAAGVRPRSPGTVGASPAATAAWLGGPDGDPDALAYLDTVVRDHGGPVPCATPITVFERAWVIASLARVGVAVTVPVEVTAGLLDSLGPTGTPAAPGLPADADTSAVALYALGLLGQPVDPQCLLGYELDDHFCTWPGEDGWSVTTNAHVLDALGGHCSTVRPPGDRYRSTIEKVSSWLLDRQQPTGEWSDRWHSSPFYATACAVLALSRHGRHPAIPAAVDRAVDWVVANQRADGGWGRWSATVEETAYAVHVLLGTDRPVGPAAAAAAARGRDLLERADADRPAAPALWHDKDLYAPTMIVRASVLAALHLSRSRVDLLPPARWPAPRTASGHSVH